MLSGVRQVLVFVLLALTALGCDKPQQAEPSPESSVQGPSRVVTFAPSITEVVFALGQGERVVGVTDFCTFPPQVAELSRVGGAIDPNLERIALLEPDLLILPGKVDALAEFAAQHSIPTLDGYMDSLAGIDKTIGRIGEALHVSEESGALRASIQAELDALRAQVADRPRVKVLLIASRTEHNLNNLFTMGGKSFLSELLTVAGGDNIYSDATLAYPEASKETVVVREPDVIIEFHAGEKLDDAERQAFIDDWNAMPTLPAVRNGRIHLLTLEHALVPGPRIAYVARAMAEFLYPVADSP
jgi:iron complex transport system substrate-binding protein